MTQPDDCTLAPDCPASVHLRACASAERDGMPGIEDIKRVTYNPGDTLVVRLLGRLSRADADKVRSYVEPFFPGARILVIDEVTEITVMAPDVTPAQIPEVSE